MPKCCLYQVLWKVPLNLFNPENIGQAHATTGICCGLRKCVVFLMISIPCFTIEGLSAYPLKSGTRAGIPGIKLFERCLGRQVNCSILLTLPRNHGFNFIFYSQLFFILSFLQKSSTFFHQPFWPLTSCHQM